LRRRRYAQRCVHFFTVMPRLDRGIQYAAADVVRASSPTKAAEYWIARRRGR
jgi:hypothetical protein